jgi:hypothetical protein
VGGVSERAGAKAEGSNPFAICSFACVSVKGIPVPWKAPFFAERRRNEDLGRLHVPRGGILRFESLRRRQRMSEGRRGGERRRHTPQSVCIRGRHERSSHCTGRRVLRSVLRPVRVDPHYAPRRKPRWWGVRAGIAVGQTRASGRNRHRGCLDGRSAARHVSPLPRGRRRGTKEKEGGRGLRPCEDRSSGLVARTS